MYFLCLCLYLNHHHRLWGGQSMWREDAARFGKDILLRPPSPPRISEGSSSEENIIFWKNKVFHLKKKFISPWRVRAWKAPFLSRQRTLRLPPGRKYSKYGRENIFSSVANTFIRVEKYLYVWHIKVHYDIVYVDTFCAIQLLKDKIKEIPIKGKHYYNMIHRYKL